MKRKVLVRWRRREYLFKTS